MEYGGRVPWVVVGQLVTRVPPKKCHLQLKQTSNAADVAVAAAVALPSLPTPTLSLVIFFLLATFWQLHFLTGVARAPCKWPSSPRNAQTLHSQHPALYRAAPAPVPLLLFALVTCVNYNFAFGVAFKSIKRNKQ